MLLNNKCVSLINYLVLIYGVLHIDFYFFFVDVTFVSATNKPPIKYLITVNKQDDIKKVKNELVNLMDENKHPEFLVVAEVFNRHISKILVKIFMRFISLFVY